MDEINEEIALEPVVSQNEDNEVLNKKKFKCKSDNIQNQRQKLFLFIRIFNSKKDIKYFILWIILWICLLLITGPFSLYITYSVPTVKSRNMAAHIFSEERALDYLSNLTQYGSRVSNTRGNINARNFLISQIEHICSMNKRSVRCEIDLQNFTDDYYNNQLQNILVRVSNPLIQYKNISSLMLSAHYDSVEFSPGSSDDGSGVVILLELLSNLINDWTVNFSNVNLIILFTNAEEPGAEGAKAFIINHKWRSNIIRFINVDSISCNEVTSLIQIKPSQLIIDYSRVSRPRANVILESILPLMEIFTEYEIYSSYGSLFGYDFVFLLDGYIYHTLLDHSSIFKKGVLQDLGENLGILIRNILRGYIYEIKNFDDKDPFIYFDIFGRYLIIYKMSTSIIIQRILIILIIIIGFILIIFDHIFHRRKTLNCNDSYCIYFYFKSPFIIRIISIILYVISNIISICIGILLSIGFAWFMSKIRPVSWYGNSTLAIFLFSLPCLIGFITMEYLCNILFNIILRKFSNHSFQLNISNINNEYLNRISLDFEQNLSILLIYCLLMIISIIYNNRLSYIILVWSIFICPIYIFFMIIEFIVHWKEIQWSLFKEKSYWLYLPLIISIIPLSHTIEIIHRLIRIIIPLLSRKFSYEWSFRGNLIISSIISIPTIFIILIFTPILQRTKYFLRILIILLIKLFIIFLIAYNRQSFTNIHPSTFYAEHLSKSIFKVEEFTNVPFIVPLVSQSSAIKFIAYNGVILSPILDQFSIKSGHILYNRECFKPTVCIFEDTFNRTISIQYIEIKSINNFMNYTIIIRHVLAYNIEISSNSFTEYTIRNQFNIPRTETIIDIILYSSLFSFEINIKIRRCDLNDSPFLVLFTRLIPNMVPMGEAYCRAIQDDATLIIDSHTFHDSIIE